MSLNHTARFLAAGFSLLLLSIVAVTKSQAIPPPPPPPPPPHPRTTSGTNIYIKNNYLTSSGGIINIAGPGRFRAALLALHRDDVNLLRTALDAYRKVGNKKPLLDETEHFKKDLGFLDTIIPLTSLTSLTFQGITEHDADVFAASILYSDALSCLDIGLQSFHGNADLGSGLGRRGLDGYELSLGVDLTSRRAVASGEVAIILEEAAIKEKLNIKKLILQLEGYAQGIKDGVNRSAPPEKIEEYIHHIENIVGGASPLLDIDNVTIDAIEADNEKLFPYAEELVRVARSFDVVGLANFRYIRPLGGTREVGLALSRLTPWHTGTKLAEKRKYYGIQTALNVQGVWLAPSTQLSTIYPGYNPTSALRTTLALYWQDGMPYVDHASGDLVANRWRFQTGCEYQFSNVVDGNDAYDFFVRYRNPSKDGKSDSPEVLLSVGNAAGNNLQVGLSLTFNFASSK